MVGTAHSAVHLHECWALAALMSVAMPAGTLVLWSLLLGREVAVLAHACAIAFPVHLRVPPRQVPRGGRGPAGVGGGAAGVARAVAVGVPGDGPCRHLASTWSTAMTPVGASGTSGSCREADTQFTPSGNRGSTAH